MDTDDDIVFNQIYFKYILDCVKNWEKLDEITFKKKSQQTSVDKQTKMKINVKLEECLAPHFPSNFWQAKKSGCISKF